MHLYIIAQYLDLFEQGEDRLWKLGRDFVSRGESVTVFTGKSGIDLDLGSKMIGLAQKEGVNLVGFNIPYGAAMDNRRKLSAFLRFKRLAERQGKQLPKPDLILALSPPLTALVPALNLSKYYEVPLVVEIRELWPDAPIQRGTLKNRFLVRAARRLETKVYEKADRVIAGSRGIADAVKERWVERAKVTVIPQMDSDEGLIELYNQALKGLIKREK